MPKTLILTTKTPFIKGGAEYHAEQLRLALIASGHEVDTLAYPFNYTSLGDIIRTAYILETEDVNHLDVGSVDHVICLKFPTYYASHSKKVVWLLHQHRPVYDEWRDDEKHTPYEIWMRDKIYALDQQYLRPLSNDRLFTNSKNVSARLRRHLNIQSRALYHPPPIASIIRHDAPGDFIFLPGRLETLKRQSLLISAMRHVRSPVRAVITGDGGQRATLRKLIESENVSDRVQLLPSVSLEKLLEYYAQSLAVFYGPYDEDYGYVTLEAMLAKKAVITCSDSGGPLEFVRDKHTGYVIDPDPEMIAEKIDTLARNKPLAYRMGQEGFERYLEMDISWDKVVQDLTARRPQL